MEEIHQMVKDESLIKNAIAFHVPVQNIVPSHTKTDITGNSCLTQIQLLALQCSCHLHLQNDMPIFWS